MWLCNWAVGRGQKILRLMMENAYNVSNRLLVETWMLIPLLLRAQKEMRNLVEKTFQRILSNHKQIRNTCIKFLLLKALKGMRNMLLKKWKKTLLDSGENQAELCPSVLWKADFKR